MKGKIIELFASIQGEGLYFGQRQLFVRFHGCNLHCKFCDTRLEGFMEYDLGELFKKIVSFKEKCEYISFTGGEPLLQKDFLKSLLKLTQGDGFKNYLETNGTLPEALEEVIEYVDVIAMDFKLPSSTGMSGYWEQHSKFLKIASQKEVFVKVVICEDTSLEDLIEAVHVIRNSGVSTVLVLQPDSFQEHSRLAEKLEKFKGYCLENNVVACVIPQMHKLMGIK
jgi:organic radical activating enzyme